MRVEPTSLPGVLLVQPRIFPDDRGYFFEMWQEERYRQTGICGPFVQDNLSCSRWGVLRGLHYQQPYPQAKLVSVLSGQVLDVVVDIRVGSPTFGRAESFLLSGESGRQLYIPEGFAHGFVVTSESAVFLYKCTEYYHPEAEGTVLWSDPALEIEWPVRNPSLSPKDRAALPLREIPEERLPQYRSR